MHSRRVGTPALQIPAPPPTTPLAALRRRPAAARGTATPRAPRPAYRGHDQQVQLAGHAAPPPLRGRAVDRAAQQSHGWRASDSDTPSPASSRTTRRTRSTATRSLSGGGWRRLSPAPDARGPGRAVSLPWRTKVLSVQFVRFVSHELPAHFVPGTEDYLRSAFGRARRSRPASARVAPVELEILRARALHDVRPQLALCQRSEVLRPPCASVFPYLPSPGTLGRAAHSALRCLQRHCSNIWSDASLHRALLRPSRHLAARLCTGPESASVSVGRITPTWCWHELNSPLSMHV